MADLLHSPADVLRWLLVREGVLSNPNEDPLLAWPGYAGLEPDLPDEVVTLYNTSPQLDGRSMPTGESFTHWAFQVRLRAMDDKTGWAKAQSILAFFDTVNQTTIDVDGHTYLIPCVAKTQLVVMGLERPSARRSLFTINGLVTIRALT